MPVSRRRFETIGEPFPNNSELLVFALLLQQGGILFYANSLMNEEGCVTPVINDQIWSRTVRPGQRLFGAPPVILQGFSLPRKNGGGSRLRNGSRGMVLSREDIAGCPSKISPQTLQGFNQHGRLNRHVKTACDFHSGQRFFRTILFPDGHQARHLILGKAHFLPSPGGEREIRNLVRHLQIDFQKFHILPLLMHDHRITSGALPAA